MKLSELRAHIASRAFDPVLRDLYGTDETVLEAQRARYLRVTDTFSEKYADGCDREAALFSVGGRSEISGNHTDHNHGRVIAAAVDLDIIAVASARDDRTVRVSSEHFPEDTVELDAYPEPDSARFYSSASLIAGVAAGFARAGYKTGGFDACTTSDVLGGSGLSSSAAFEDMIGVIQSGIYNEGSVPLPELAKISQYAENVFFGKPSGLMDQTACAVGGFVAIDFRDPANPVIAPLSFDLSAAGYALCIVSPGGSHADLNDEYAAVPGEMKQVASLLGAAVLRDVTEADVTARLPELRRAAGDRAVLRALHFLAENERVKAQTMALEGGDLDAFLDGVLASGNSSFRYLQNVYPASDPQNQPLSLALCLTESYFGKQSGKRAAWRVHGGGFAGTIQAFVPAEAVDGYRAYMDAAFGAGACKVLSVRRAGAIRIL